MKTNQSRKPGLLRIFLSYFRPHWKLFLVDITCAVLVAAIDLAYPLISRKAMYGMLPNRMFTVFFVVMGLVVLAYLLRAGLQ